MLICLSSGARARYLEDIVRSLALPQGAALQFRYDESFIHPDTLRSLKEPSINGTKVLICYLFSTDHQAATSVVPTRFAEISEVKIVGSSVILVFKICPFALVKDYDALAETLEKVSEIPRWDKSGSEPELDGFLVFSAKDPLTIAEPSTDISTFEKIVSRLIDFADFRDAANEPRTWLFFHVMGLRSKVRVPQIAGRDAIQTGCPYKVAPARTYALEIYHYFPNPHRFRGKFSRIMQISAAGDAIVFHSGNSIVVDTEYDIKVASFSVKRTTSDNGTVISLGVAQKDGTRSISEIELPLTITVNRLLATLQFAAIAAGVALPGLVSINAAGKPLDAITILLVTAGGALASFGATFGYKRGV